MNISMRLSWTVGQALHLSMTERIRENTPLNAAVVEAAFKEVEPRGERWFSTAPAILKSKAAEVLYTSILSLEGCKSRGRHG
jgi:hypothetical protein